jgi:hypothetical protein
MKELLFEYIIEHKQLELFKIWLVESGVEVDEGIDAWVEEELNHLGLQY